MKYSVSFLLALGQLAAVGHTLGTRADIDVECFELVGADKLTLAFNNQGACSSECANSSHSVFAVQDQSCVCLDSLPSDDKKVDADECNVPCPGFMPQTCGGRPSYPGRPGYYSVGTIDPSWFEPNATNTTTSTTTASSTISGTAIPSSSNVPPNSTNSVTPPSSSASGSSASASTTVESSSAAAPAFGISSTVVSSLVYAIAVLAALV